MDFNEFRKGGFQLGEPTSGSGRTVKSAVNGILPFTTNAPDAKCRRLRGGELPEFGEFLRHQSMQGRKASYPLMKSAHTHYQPLAGRRILITGGTTGLGRAIALRLSAEGASVLIFGRNKAQLDDAMREISSNGFPAIGMVADVTDKADRDKVFQRVDEEWGGLDVLVNNAAVGAGKPQEESEEDVEYAVRTNVTGYIVCAKHALSRMKENDHIVLVGSISADRRNPGGSVYVATKSAIQGFAESFRQEASEMGVKVSLVEPGKTGSDMIGQDLEEQRESQEKLEMLKAEDIAVAVEYILTQPQRCNVSVLKVVPTREPSE